MVKRPAVLLLDEATSALDAASERLVQESIDALQHRSGGEGGGCRQTMIVIAHRLSTVRNADKICVVQAGRIVETGTHDELLLKKGRYADLVRTQLEGHEDDHAAPDVPTTTPLPAAARVGADQQSYTAVESDSVEEGESTELRFPSHVFRNPFEPNYSALIEVDDAASVLSSVLGIRPKGRQLASSTADGKIDPKLVSKVWAIVMRSPGWFAVSLLGSAVFGSVFPGTILLVATLLCV